MGLQTDRQTDRDRELSRGRPRAEGCGWGVHATHTPARLRFCMRCGPAADRPCPLIQVLFTWRMVQDQVAAPGTEPGSDGAVSGSQRLVFFCGKLEISRL